MMNQVTYLNSGTGKEIPVSDANGLPVSVNNPGEPVNDGLQVGGFDPLTPPAGTDFPFNSSTLTKTKKILFTHLGGGGALKIRLGDTGPIVFTLPVSGSYTLEYSVPENLFADAADVGGGADADVLYLGET